MKKNYLISIFFTAISVFILSYTFYYSEIIYESTRQEFYFKYYVISLIFFGFSISSFFFSKDLIEKIFLIFVSIIFTFYILELYLLVKTLMRTVKNTEELWFMKFSIIQL